MYSLSDPHSPPPASVCDVDHSSTHNKGNVSSVHPIQSSPQLSSTRRSPQDRTEKASQQAFRQNQGHIPSENMDHFAAVSGSNGTFPRNVVKRGAPGFEVRFLWFGGCVKGCHIKTTVPSRNTTGCLMHHHFHLNKVRNVGLLVLH